MSEQLDAIEVAISAIAQGKMIVLVDDASRENEGDLVMAADQVTPEAINFMLHHARGLICLSMESDDFERLQIPMMTKHNTSLHYTAFGVSIEAAQNVTTGISAADRAETIRVAVDEASTPADIVMPGHMFPLKAEKGGVLTRNGHTEGGVDFARLAGRRPAAVICEIMNSDGTMARLDNLREFAKQHELPLVSIHDLQTYRVKHEKLVDFEAEAELPIDGLGSFTLRSYTAMTDNAEYIALTRPVKNPEKPPLVRLHSACATGDIFGSKRCDCGAQLKMALSEIAEQGGVLLYLPQEGRGIGLANKIKAYALQEQGMDTVEANQHLGFGADLRDYGMAAQILRDMNVTQMRLLTNNPRKVQALQRYGLDVVERIPVESQACESNIRYLKTKREKLGHWLQFTEECES